MAEYLNSQFVCDCDSIEICGNDYIFLMPLSWVLLIFLGL